MEGLDVLIAASSLLSRPKVSPLLDSLLVNIGKASENDVKIICAFRVNFLQRKNKQSQKVE